MESDAVEGTPQLLFHTEYFTARESRQEQSMLLQFCAPLFVTAVFWMYVFPDICVLELHSKCHATMNEEPLRSV